MQLLLELLQHRLLYLQHIQLLHKYFHKRKPVILNKDFAEAVRTAKAGDFVYFDPPYDVVGEQSFTSYTTGGFDKKEQARLRDVFKELSRTCVCPPNFPKCVCGHRADVKIVTKKPIVAGEIELKENSRSACAKLRVAEKI